MEKSTNGFEDAGSAQLWVERRVRGVTCLDREQGSKKACRWPERLAKCGGGAVDSIANHFVGVAGLHRKRVFQEIDQRVERQRTAKRHRCPLPPGGAIPCASMEFMQQTCLADPRLADEKHSLPTSLFHLGQQILEQRDFPGPRHERRDIPLGVDEPTTRQTRRGSGAAARGSRSKSSLEEGLRGCGREDATRRGRHGQHFVHDVLSGLSRVGCKFDTILEPSDRYLLGMQSDPQLERLRVDDAGNALDGKGRVSCVAGRVLDDLETEGSLDEGRAQLDDPSTETGDLCGDLFQNPSPFVLGAAVRSPSSTCACRNVMRVPLPSHGPGGSRSIGRLGLAAMTDDASPASSRP